MILAIVALTLRPVKLPGPGYDSISSRSVSLRWCFLRIWSISSNGLLPTVSSIISLSLRNWTLATLLSDKSRKSFTFYDPFVLSLILEIYFNRIFTFVVYFIRPFDQDYILWTDIGLYV